MLDCWALDGCWPLEQAGCCRCKNWARSKRNGWVGGGCGLPWGSHGTLWSDGWTAGRTTEEDLVVDASVCLAAKVLENSETLLEMALKPNS